MAARQSSEVTLAVSHLQRTGCTPEQVKNQFRANASQLAKDADKSFRTGRKVRGASYAQLKELQAMCESKYS